MSFQGTPLLLAFERKPKGQPPFGGSTKTKHTQLSHFRFGVWPAPTPKKVPMVSSWPL